MDFKKFCVVFLNSPFRETLQNTKRTKNFFSGFRGWGGGGRGRAAAVLFEVRRAVFPDGNEPYFPLAGTVESSSSKGCVYTACARLSPQQAERRSLSAATARDAQKWIETGVCI
jgi:hypothetical protein